ncbi:UDP-3-O-(3-hydroxymyristoyl)glucosamine N-acyltransferase [Fusobacterium nucleatum]|uniref:UDP-3-O-(3-hydroxymyristoyl)glucosamine N-acyltransferase n=1 Tax=Fusobacterium nucleatum TaxID=851 RepID=UPI00235E287D|nr:UDP-3-O-(3-hydroxymyristoyl)glucosamine N-acyltransferase [Fusobacterium nucleatum]WDA45700.1 UDP-3-O-(3-hydroxymyristoyl)glucosamine N-acyltransferase [Fusobacterium nucleatum]
MKLSELNFGKIEKDGEFNWLGLTAEEYEGKKHLVFFESEKYLKELEKNSTLSCVITTDILREKIKRKDIGILVSKTPREDFFKLHNLLNKNNFYKMGKKENKISNTAKISKTAVIKSNNIVIEDNVEIDDFVVIYPNVTIKKNVKIGAGTIIGSRPLEVFSNGKENFYISAVGDIFIDENVEIYSNTTVEMGVFGTTYIGKHVHVDDLVQVGHDVKIGDLSIIVAGTVIGGRTRIGENSYLSINSTIKNGLILGKNCKVNMGAVVSQNVKENETVTGNLAIEHSRFIKNLKKITKGEKIEKNMGD